MCNMAQPVVASSTKVFGFKTCLDFEVAKSTSTKLIQGSSFVIVTLIYLNFAPTHRHNLNPRQAFPTHTHTHRHCDCEEEVGMLSCHSYLLILALLLVGGGCSDSLLTLEAATQQMVWWGMNECS